MWLRPCEKRLPSFLGNLDDPFGVKNVLDVRFRLFLQLVAYSNSRLGELDDSPNISRCRYHNCIAVYSSYGSLHVPDLLVTIPDSGQNLSDMSVFSEDVFHDSHGILARIHDFLRVERFRGNVSDSIGHVTVADSWTVLYDQNSLPSDKLRLVHRSL